MHIALHNTGVSYYSRDGCEHRSSNSQVLHQCITFTDNLQCFIFQLFDSIVFMMC